MARRLQPLFLMCTSTHMITSDMRSGASTCLEYTSWEQGDDDDDKISLVQKNWNIHSIHLNGLHRYFSVSHSTWSPANFNHDTANKTQKVIIRTVWLKRGLLNKCINYYKTVLALSRLVFSNHEIFLTALHTELPYGTTDKDEREMQIQNVYLKSKKVPKRKSKERKE